MNEAIQSVFADQTIGLLTLCALVFVICLAWIAGNEYRDRQLQKSWRDHNFPPSASNQQPSAVDQQDPIQQELI